MLVRLAVAMSVIWLTSAFFLEVGATKQKAMEDKADYWIRSGQERLHFEIRRQQEVARSRGKVAKNVILFIGDGMGMSTITAARVYKNQLAGGYGEENGFSFEGFPFIGLAKTYEVNYQVIKHITVHDMFVKSLQTLNQCSLLRTD
jgi:alkaline phosphatase